MAPANHLVSSRFELEDVSRRRAAGVYYGEHRMLCRLLGEYLAFVDTRDFMLAPRLVLDGFWEAWVTLALARYIQPGFHCVDVGANYGYYTLLMAAACERGVHRRQPAGALDAVGAAVSFVAEVLLRSYPNAWRVW